MLHFYFFSVEDSTIENLWLHIFSSEALCRFSYEAMTTGKSAGELHTAIIGSAEFSCKFPFFWIVKDEIDSKWETAKATGTIHYLCVYLLSYTIIGIDRQDIYVQLCSLLSETDISKVLHTAVATEHWEELYHLYLLDFLKSIHKVTHHKAAEEYEVYNAVSPCVSNRIF